MHYEEITSAKGTHEILGCQTSHLVSDKETGSIHIEHSSAFYRFGDGEQKKALRCVTFPRRFGGKHVNIQTDVIDYAIPLLMSHHLLKVAGIIINVTEDTVNLPSTSTGHYILPIFSGWSSFAVSRA